MRYLDAVHRQICDIYQGFGGIREEDSTRSQSRARMSPEIRQFRRLYQFLTFLEPRSNSYLRSRCGCVLRDGFQGGLHREFLVLCNILSSGLLLMEFIDAIREGDGTRIMRVWKYLLLQFKVERRTNYSVEAFIILAQYHFFFVAKDGDAANLEQDRQYTWTSWKKCVM